MKGLVYLLFAFASLCRAQETPYFVTYSHHLEEPESLEIETKLATGRPAAENWFFGNSVEFEYGVTAWWTSEIYVDFTGTPGDSTVPGGFRFENRLRPLMREHWINPVVYAEYEDINGANKSVLEVVGHDGAADLGGTLAEGRRERKHEAELKLILSSDAKGWNFSENLVFEKNLMNSPWEFGYAFAASRPLRFAGSAHRCMFCLRTLNTGLEIYGGLGDTNHPGLHNTSHYAGPVGGWQIPGGPRLSAGIGFGLNDYSLPRIFRVGLAYEIGQVRRGSR